MELGTKIIFAGFGWVAIIRYSERLIGFITTLILAKHIAPEDFGIIALASMLIEIIQIFKDFGLSQALIYQKTDIESASSTAFWLIISYSFILFIIAASAAFLTAKFYNISILTPVIILFSTNLVWNSIRSVPATLMAKYMDFKSLFVPEVVPVAVASVISILMAINGMGVWSLVARSLIFNIGCTVLIWKYTTFRPSLRFDTIIAKELFSYGKYLIGASVLAVALYNVDKAYVSKVLGMAELGYYTLAMSVASLPVSEIGHVICRVMFPVFSLKTENLEFLRGSLSKAIRYSGLFTIPMTFGIIAYGPDIIMSIYGEKWKPMGYVLQILSMHALLRSFSSIISELFKGIGKPNFIQKFALLRFVSLSLLGIPMLVYFGLPGICYLVVFQSIAILVMELITLKNLLTFSIFHIFKSIMIPLVLSITITTSTYYVFVASHYFINLRGMSIMIGVVVSVVMYFIFLYLFDKEAVSEVRNLVKVT